MMPHYNIDRYVLQLYPALILLAAAGSVCLCGLWQRLWLRRSVAGTLVLIWCLIPLFFRDQIRGKTRQQYANSAVIALAKSLPDTKPIFVLQGISILYHTLKFDCAREVYVIGSLSEEEVARIMEAGGAYYLLRSEGFGWPQMPAVIRQYQMVEKLRLDPEDPYGSPPYYVYDILPRTLIKTDAGTATAFYGAPARGAEPGLLHLIYIAGERGVAAGGSIRIALPQDWSFSLPSGPDATTSESVTAQAGPGRLEVKPEVILLERGIEVRLTGALKQDEFLTVTCPLAAIDGERSDQDGQEEKNCLSFAVDLAGNGNFQAMPVAVCVRKVS